MLANLDLRKREGLLMQNPEKVSAPICKGVKTRIFEGSEF
jgi:hypothetical protein